MLIFLNVLQYLVLALWVGAMFAFGALFAPVLFRVLPSKEQAGSIVSETLARIDSLGLVSAGILLVVTALQAIDSKWQALDLGRVLISVVMVALLVWAASTVRQRLAAVKEKMGRPIDEVPETDPLRLEYRRYHRISRSIYFVNMLLGTLLIVLSALRPQA